jgi:Ca2+-binding EF-hand superfamily protein
MAWSTLESNIRDKIEGSRVDVVSFLERRDLAHRGQVSLKVLRKVIEKFAVDITDEHFNNMVNRLATLDDSQLVDYKDFFFNLGVVLKPTDSCGVSSKIIKSSQQSAEEHQANQQYRSEEIDQRVINRASQMESEEIVTRIRDKLMQRTGDLHRAFQYYATKHHDRISRKNFRKFLENYGFVLSDDQFNRLCVELSFNKGYMRYVDFLHSFDQHCLWTPMSNSRPSNHRVNEIRGDEFGLSAEEVEARLRDKLRENFEDLREAFYKFDDDHNGILTKRNFRCMLDTFMLIMTDEEFEKFCQQMGINNTSRITYEDFLNVFQLRETKNGHTWLTSVHRYNKTKPTPKLSVDEAHDAVVQKMHEIWHDLAKAFQAMKSSRNRSVIQKSELRLMLSKFMIQLDKEQFNRLWARFDIDGKGFVSYDDFSKHLLADEFAPGDHDGVSGQIIDENREELKRRHQDQLSRLAENQLNEAQYVSALTTDDVLLHLRDHIQDQFTDLLAAFNSFDTFKRGFLTGRDFQDLLGRLNILLDDDQLFDFLDRLGLSMPKSKLMYKQFVEIFEEGKADSFKLGQPEDVQYPLVQFANLPACDVETRLRQKVAEQHDILLSACRSFDQLNTGLMLTVDLRRILDNFCFKMTDAHFRHLMQSFSKTAVPYDASFINYQQFLETFRDSNNKDPQKMMESLQQIMAISRCHSTEEIWACLREKVADNALVIGRAFADVDSVGQGAVSKSDFRSIINMHAVTISDEQFDKLWPVLPLNEFANVDYNYFMKLCMMEKSLERPQSSHGSYLLTPKPSTFEPRRPGSSCSATSRCGSALSMKSVERPFTPLVNAIETETKVRDFVHKHWKNIQKDCRGLDVENCGQISQQDFRNIAETYNFGLTDHEMFKLLLKYDLHNNDQFCYADFLRHFIIDSRVQPAAADAGRGSRQTAHNWLRRSSSGPNMITSRSSNHDEDPAVQLALDQIGDCVVANWKEMRRQLRRANPSGRATKMQFRQVLRNVNADLTEEQFARIFECFRDNGDEEKIRYDDFFRRYFQIK